MTDVEGRSRARRHRPLGAALCSIALALVLTACGASATGQTTASRPTQSMAPPVTLPAVHAPKGSFAFDYGQLRLWLPASWAAENETGCLTPLHDVVLLADACPHAGSSGTYLRLSPQATSTGGATKLTVGHTTVYQTTTGPGTRWSVPSLDVTIQILSSAARSVARTLGPSSLHALLTLHHPVAVPDTWKTVRYSGIQARVPPHWQVVHQLFQLTCHGFLNPGRRPPLVLLGDHDQDPYSSCPPGFDPTTQLRPTNGLWLSSSTTAPFLPGGAGTITATTHLDGRTLTLRSTPSDGPLLEVTVRHGPRHTVAVIAMGTNPTTAEAILTSDQPS